MANGHQRPADDGLTPLQRVLLLAFIAALLVYTFVFDSRDIDLSKSGLLESVATVLEITLGIVALLGLLNARSIVDWLIKHVVAELRRHNLVVPSQRPAAEGRRRTSSVGGDEEFATDPEPSQPIMSETVEPDLNWDRMAAERRRRQRMIFWTKFGERIHSFSSRAPKVIGSTLLVLLVIALVSVIAAIRPVPPVPLSDAPVVFTPPANESSRRSCPANCGDASGALMCRLLPGSNPTTLARALLGPNASPRDVDLFGFEIWERNRETLQGITDRRIPPDTPLSIPARPQLCLPA